MNLDKTLLNELEAKTEEKNCSKCLSHDCVYLMSMITIIRRKTG
jgi:hypothetical protein